MRDTFFAKIVAAGLVLVATGTAWAQGNDETRHLAQFTVTQSMARALNRPVALAEFRSLASARLPQPRTPLHSRTALGRKIAYGVAGGFLGMLAGGAAGGTLTRGCCGDDPGLSGMLVGMPVGTVLGAAFGVWLAGE